MKILRFVQRPREHLAEVFDPAAPPEGVVECDGGHAVRLSGVLVPVRPGDLLFRTAYGLQPMSRAEVDARFLLVSDTSEPQADSEISPNAEVSVEAPAPRVSIWGRARAWFRR